MLATVAAAAACAAAGDALLPASAALGAAQPTIHTDRGCYKVGQPVAITGAGFASSRRFELAVDGIDLGQSQTSASGAFAVKGLLPGGLAAGQPQLVHHLDATDGTTTAATSFTVTHTPAGARLLAAGGNPNTLRAPFEVWGFALDGKRLPVYAHYVAPSGGVRSTLSLGHTGGQCGYLRTSKRRVFPFAPSRGTWTLQIDTSRTYSRHPSGPASRIAIRIS